jgi:hypothetical protein
MMIKILYLEDLWNTKKVGNPLLIDKNCIDLLDEITVNSIKILVQFCDMPSQVNPIFLNEDWWSNEVKINNRQPSEC